MKRNVDDKRKKKLKEQNWKSVYSYIKKNQTSEEMLNVKGENHWTCNGI